MDGFVKMSAKDMYIDLLGRCLLDDIYEDTSLPPEALEKQRIGRRHPARAHTMVGRPRLDNLRSLMQTAIDDGIPGDFIETGVWRGGCCIFMRGLLAANGITDRHVYVADSFEGLPPPKENFPADRRSKLHERTNLAVSDKEVRSNFEAYGLLDDKVRFVKGFFSDTLPKLDAGPFALIRLDGDMYESTYVALENLYPKLSPGGFVIIDDYGALISCRTAVSDYRAKHQITEEITRVDWTGAWWRKAGGPGSR